MTTTARGIALTALCRQQSDDAFSNLILDRLLSDSGLSERDKAFAARLFYGVLERRITLDACIADLSRVPMHKLDSEVLQILRMGVYQLLYLDAVPDNAAVHESVTLTGAVRKTSAKGYVNALLRAFIRNGKRVPLPDLPALRRESVRYSCPEPLIQKWETEYGAAQTERILQASLGAPPLYIRVNTQKTDAHTLICKLRDEQIPAEPVEAVADCLRIRGVHGVERTRAFAEGLFHVQDLSSQTLCALVAPKRGETLYDLCAAPGGKSFTLAEQMQDSGKILAFDRYAKRTALIEQGANRLGLRSIQTAQMDATRLDASLPPADKVLCDVPCSGYGVIRRKPEIKYKDPNGFASLCAVQRAILHTAAHYVKPDGLLVYSTCTLSRAENDAVAEAFLSEDKRFSPWRMPDGDYKHTFFPQPAGGDGFFLAVFQRTEA